jgi:hypothetical protein
LFFSVTLEPNWSDATGLISIHVCLTTIKQVGDDGLASCGPGLRGCLPSHGGKRNGYPGFVPYDTKPPL